MARVTIGVPIYKGGLYLEDALASIRRQTFADFTVLLSIDGEGSDPDGERIVASYCRDDPRFVLFRQPARLGWVGNINWLLGRVETEFWYFHQQDDVVREDYLAQLIGVADETPSAALVYSDVNPAGQVSRELEQVPSVRGTPLIRMLDILHEHLPAFAFRGLTRRRALLAAGPIVENSAENYGVDITWVCAVARSGDLIHVPLPLYWKRYHGANTESKWWGLPRESKLSYWAQHCVDILSVAMQVSGTAQEARLLWVSAIERLLSPHVSRTFLHSKALTGDERRVLLRGFLRSAHAGPMQDFSRLLDMDWPTIERMSRLTAWIPHARVKIVDYGPHPVRSRTPFNVQTDGSSALWVRTDKPLQPDTVIQLGKDRLSSVVSGFLATATVPEQSYAYPHAHELKLVDPNGRALCSTVVWEVTPDT